MKKDTPRVLSGRGLEEPESKGNNPTCAKLWFQNQSESEHGQASKHLTVHTGSNTVRSLSLCGSSQCSFSVILIIREHAES